MNLKITQVPLNKEEAVVITRYGQVTACSLQPIEDTDLEALTSKVREAIKQVKHETKKQVMDLMTAKEKAKEATRDSKTGKVIFIDVDSEGECKLSKEQSEASIHAFSDGAEVPLPPLALSKEKVKQIKTQNKKEKVMATKEKKTAKKAAKKTAKKEVKAAKREKKILTPPKGGKLMTVKEIIASIKKGNKVLNHAGKSLTLAYMEKMQDKDRQMPVSVPK